MMTKTMVFTVVLLFTFISTGMIHANADRELLAGVDSLASYMDTDFSAEYTILQDVPGQGVSRTVAGVFRRDSNETYVIVIMEPVNSRGQGYLKQGNTLWFYDPESRRFNVTARANRFQNTNARNSDFTRSTLAQDYRVISGEDVILGRFRCRLLTLEAMTTEVTFSRMKIWVCNDGLLRKSEDYSPSGQLLRTTAIPDYHLIDGRYVPRQMVIVDELRGALINGTFVKERTQITVTGPSFARVADSVFSQVFLESVNR